MRYMFACEMKARLDFLYFSNIEEALSLLKQTMPNFRVEHAKIVNHDYELQGKYIIEISSPNLASAWVAAAENWAHSDFSYLINPVRGDFKFIKEES